MTNILKPGLKIKDATDSEIKALIEILQNTLLGNIVLKSAEKKKLLKYKKKIDQLVNPKSSFDIRRAHLIKSFKTFLILLKIAIPILLTALFHGR